MDSMFNLNNKTAIVTGGGSGIGKSIAVALASQGAKVAILDVNETGALQTKQEIESNGQPCASFLCDVAVQEDVDRCFQNVADTFGSIDIVVNNAGGNTFMAPIATLRASGWAKAIALNLDASVQLIQAALPSLIASGHGSIVNVSSVTALRAAPLLGAYGAAKAALVSATQTLAVELGTEPVRVNALVPGWIATDLTDFLRGDDAMEESVLGRVPMHRWGRPEEIAQAALFLASDASSFMTGQSLVVDGGLSANP